MSRKIIFYNYSSNYSIIDEPESEAQKVKAAVYLNIALCHMKVKNHTEAKKAVSAIKRRLFHCLESDTPIKLAIFMIC